MRTSITYLLFLMPYFSLAQSIPTPKITKDSLVVARFQRELEEDLQNDNVHGSISSLVFKDQKILSQKTMGYKSTSGNIIADSLPIYRIASLTKTFTTTLMIILAEKGALTIDDPVEKYVPEVKIIQGYSDESLITLKQLASHTAGLPREPGMIRASTGPVREWEKKLLASIPSIKLTSAPGKKFNYSNIGFALLGLALERAEGKAYIQLIQEYILTPLNMNRTYFIVPDADSSYLVPGIHNYSDDIIRNVEAEPSLQGILSEAYGGYGIPNGGLYSTTGDLAKFLIALTFGKLITPEDLTLISEVPHGGSSYGLGVNVFKVGGLNAIGHGGGIPGYKAQFFVDKRTHYGVVLLRNYDTGATDMVMSTRKLIQKLAK